MDDLCLILIVGSVLCLIHLGIGLALGWHLRPVHARIDVLDDLPDSRHATIDLLSGEWHAARHRLTRVAAAAGGMRPTPLEMMQQWLGELDDTVSELRRRLEGSAPAQQQTFPARRSDEEESRSMSKDQLSDLIECIGQAGADDTSLSSVRYRFSVKQPLAPVESCSPLPAEAFGLVQCHDLSTRDIRFFLDHRPTVDRVIVGLGVPTPAKWVAADIQEFRPAYMYGRVGYLVTARFIACIEKEVPMAIEQA